MSKNLDIRDKKVALKSKNLDIHDENEAPMSKNLDIQSLNSPSKDQNLDIGIKVKINNIDIVGIINSSEYSNSIKSTLMSIFDQFFNDIFSRTDIIKFLNVSNASGTNYINHLLNLNIIEPVKGLGSMLKRFPSCKAKEKVLVNSTIN